jgi:hypothetical protein
VKFFELEPLNARKNGGYAATPEANSGIRKNPAAAVAPPQDCPSHPE